MINILILDGNGFNCAKETSSAFLCASGAKPEILHFKKLLNKPDKLHQYDGLCIPGGFSYGDEWGSGHIAAKQLENLPIRKFISQKKPVLGICNGFQILSKLNIFGDVRLINNLNNKFTNCLVELQTTNSFWFKGIDSLELYVRNKEGRLTGEITNPVLTYKKYNNSGIVAGITNNHGNVLGMMPHPETSLSGFRIFLNMVKYAHENSYSLSK